MEKTTFNGFGKNALRFFSELSAHNNKEWFNENKSWYEKDILEPAAAFVMDLGPRLQSVYPDINFGTQRNGSGSIMRIYRDIRFSPDKRPLKENLGLIFWIGEGKKVERPCFYFHMDPQRSFFYGGQHMFPKDVLERYRSAVDDAAKGTKLERILADLKKMGLSQMEEPEYKRVPRGYSPDHPRGELLRMKGLGTGTELSKDDAVHGRLVDVCYDYAAKMQPLLGWLGPLNTA